MSEASIFAAALEKTGAEERAAYLAEACAGDEKLRRRVEALLRAHAEPDEILDAPEPRACTVDDAPRTEGPGTVIGPYKLLQQIGEGGMGVVYMAEQQEPVRRRVALKVIKAGMDSAHAVARFEAERQALALMDHPHIAKVFDGGTTASGRPYFVMELVKGIPITKYCDEHRLTPRQRLELFVPVCQALQHAHQKGIIHRDVKPSNVLIAPYDGKPVVKVIDFGVAKAAGQRLTERTLFTEFGAVVGTVEYMSPEQAELNNQDIDTRSDVYSLGVLLYELLTGTTPLTKQRLQQVAFMEMLRLIREEEPPRPSTRLSASKDALPTISAQRQLGPAQLTKLVRGELDWIVMKALEKDRGRRYETAIGLARDIERYLHDEPVEACPLSAGYKLRKFTRQYKRALTVAGGFVLLLVLGVAVSTWQSVRATWAEGQARLAQSQAEAERDRAIKAEAEARKQEQEAKQQKAKAEAINKFLTQDLLAVPRPEAQGKDVTIKQALQVAVPRIRKAFAAQPETEAAVRLTVGNTYHSLGAYAEAEGHLRRALELSRELRGDEHPETLAAVGSLANCLVEQWKHTEAEPLSRHYLEACRRLWGAEHATTLGASNNYGRVLGAQGRSAESEALYRPLLESSRRVRGPEHPHTLVIMNNLAAALTGQSQLGEAEELHRQALEIHRRLGSERLGTVVALNNLAYVLRDQGKLAEAERLFREELPLTRKLFPEEHYYIGAALSGLGVTLVDGGRAPEAEPLLRESVAIHRKALAGKDWRTAFAESALGACLTALNQYAEAEPLLLQSYPCLRGSKVGPPKWERDALDRIIKLYDAWGKPDEAARWRKDLERIKTVEKQPDP